MTNMDRILSEITKGTPRADLEQVTGLRKDQVQDALYNLKYGGKIEKIPNSQASKGRNKGLGYAEYRLVHKTPEKTVKGIASVFDLARM